VVERSDTTGSLVQGLHYPGGIAASPKVADRNLPIRRPASLQDATDVTIKTGGGATLIHRLMA